MMDREQWQQVSALLDEGLALPKAEVDAWLDALAPPLRATVARMLAHARAPAGPEPPAGLDARSFDECLSDALLQGDLGAAAPDLAGTRLGAWELVRKIGEGGMGQVWLAERADGLYRGQAAIKLLRAGLPVSAFAGRLGRERNVLARLNHPAIARLLDAGIDQGHAYLVLELVKGRPLSEFVRAHLPALADRVALLRAIAAAVECAHAQLVVHRDLKPSNILVTDDGHAKLLDFGVAALLDGDDAGDDLTRQTGRGLTLGYAAPEQITGAGAGIAADVFALGVMLFELASGGLPFGQRGAARHELERAVLQDEPRRLAAAPDDPAGPGRPQDAGRARGDLEAVIAKALRKEPGARYLSVTAFIDDLDRWRTSRPVAARHGRRWHRARLWLRRHALAAGSAALVAASLVAGLGVSLWQRQRATDAARESAEVTSYLQELIASASPDRHGGQWPTVLELMQKARDDIDHRFADSPDTRLRVLQVLVSTNQELNRNDIALVLARELVDESAHRYGEDDRRTLQARLDQANSWILQGEDEQVVTSIEPALPRLSRAFGPDSRERLQGLQQLNAAYSHLGRLDDARKALEQVGRLVDGLKGPDAELQRASYLNHLSINQSAQGHAREAIETLARTERYWGSTDPAWQREVLTYQRNMLALQIRAADYAQIEPRVRALLPRIDALMKPGSGLDLSLRDELGRYLLETGQWQAALRQREDDLSYARAAGVGHPVVLLALQAKLLQVRALTHDVDAARYATEADALVTQMQTQQAWLGQQRTEISLAIARGALALDLGDLAARLLAPLASEPSIREGWDQPVIARRDHLLAQCARWRGDRAQALALLRHPLDTLRGTEQFRTVAAWSMGLDYAWALQQAGDAGAAAALAQAGTQRPEGVPAGHPLDAVAAFLAARQEAGLRDTPAVAAARAAIGQATAGHPLAESQGRASLAGALM